MTAIIQELAVEPEKRNRMSRHSRNLAEFWTPERGVQAWRELWSQLGLMNQETPSQVETEQPLVK